MVHFSAVVATLISLNLAVLRLEAAGKVLDINEKLPELIEKHPDKNWMIKFYAPWCYHCQQLEPVYNNVAEKIYNQQDRLVVGRVDCTKNGHICEKYGVDSYPTIIHISANTNVKYNGERSETALLSFASRLEGPDVNTAKDCSHLKGITNKYSLIILSNLANTNNELQSEFNSLAQAHKSNHWFYRLTGTCKGIIDEEGLYLFKKHLDTPIRFNDTGIARIDLRDRILQWIGRESFPVYGQMTQRNFERYLDSGKLLVVAVLYEYRPARRLSAQSHRFNKQFEELAKRHAHRHEDMLFAWSSDLELMEYITISAVVTPNVIFIKTDLTYHILIDKAPTESEDTIAIDRVQSFIASAHEGKLEFVGGDKYLYGAMRYIMGNLSKFLSMYRANPLLVSLIFGFPSLIVIFVIYTTCFYEVQQVDEQDDDLLDEDLHEDGGEEDEEETERISQRNGHLKQD